MTDQEIIKAVAELDGWSFVTSRDVQGKAMPEYWENENDERPVIYEQRHLPHYLTSRDAILSLIEKKDYFLKRDIFLELKRITHASFLVFLATARQLCEALLRATGKWQDHPGETPHAGGVETTTGLIGHNERTQ